jgi:hypothetical protein
MMSDCGIRADGGSEWKIFGGVFHSNNRDIDTTPALPVQNILAVGTWFENSRNGIFRAQNSFSLQLLGCHLHTFSSNALMDFQGQAGNATIKSLMAGGGSSERVINTNPTYDYDFVGTGITTDRGYRFRIAGPAGLARIDNADFLVGPAADHPDATGDGTPYDIGEPGVMKDHDLSDCVDSQTGSFAAPVDGYYEFCVAVGLGSLTERHTTALLQLVVTGVSGQIYRVGALNPGTIKTSANEYQVTGAARIFMTKGDTCRPRITVFNSTRTVSVLAGGPRNEWTTRFQGRLA